MAILRCSFGHFYDTEKYAVCPICESLRQDGAADNADENEKTISASCIIDADNDLTISYSDMKGFGCTQPVVGWLVCIKGGEKGRDWRLTAGRNFVGSSLKADIAVPGFAGDAQNAFSVIYDSRHEAFLISPGVCAQVYLNGEPLTAAVRLNDDDEISAGEVALCFRSFCREGKRRWG